MGSLNKVMLIGNLGSDPEMKQLPSGQPVANFNLATTETWGSREGGRQEKTEWHRIVIYGKLAEIAGQYLRKGRQVYLEGRLQTRSWQDQQGQKRFMTEIVVRDMVMLGSRAGAGADSGDPAAPRYARQGGAPANAGGGAPGDFPPGPEAEEPVGGDFLGDDNDLPF